jgi:hypothetical protein
MNYFDLQQLLGELVSSQHISCLDTGHKSFYSLTPMGLKALNFFKNRIPDWLRESIDVYARQNRNRFKRENQIVAEYKRVSPDEYEVTLIELKLSVTDSKQARIICNNWDTKAPEIYKFIMQNLSV